MRPDRTPRPPAVPRILTAQPTPRPTGPPDATLPAAGPGRCRSQCRRRPRRARPRPLRRPLAGAASSGVRGRGDRSGPRCRRRDRCGPALLAHDPVQPGAHGSDAGRRRCGDARPGRQGAHRPCARRPGRRRDPLARHRGGARPRTGRVPRAHALHAARRGERARRRRRGGGPGGGAGASGDGDLGVSGRLPGRVAGPVARCRRGRHQLRRRAHPRPPRLELPGRACARRRGCARRRRRCLPGGRAGARAGGIVGVGGAAGRGGASPVGPRGR